MKNKAIIDYKLVLFAMISKLDHTHICGLR